MSSFSLKSANKIFLDQKIEVHNEPKCYKCDVCLNLFPHKSKLTRHYRTHTGEKPFACQVCDKKFARKYSLVQHQAVHTGEKLFACQIWKRKFAKKSNLVEHQATHSDVRNFKCSICPEGRSFKTKRELKQHIVFHYEPKYSCNSCNHKSYTRSD